VLNQAKTTEESLDLTVTSARNMPGYAGVWVDQSHSTELGYNDPTHVILNIAFTRDLEARERELRKTWGGALCVSQAQRTEKRYARIRDEVFETARAQALSAGGTQDYVTLEVIYDDGTLQDQFNKRYGAGVVRVSSALRPYSN
jgi:hypothetical protein